MNTDTTVPKAPVILYTDGSGHHTWTHGAFAFAGYYPTPNTDPFVVGMGLSDSNRSGRAELQALGMALRWCSEMSSHLQLHSFGVVDIYSDSEYIVKALNWDWISRWQQTGGRRTAFGVSKEVANWDVWLDIIESIRKLTVSGISIVLRHVFGHSGIPGNELVDRLCNVARQRALYPPVVGPLPEHLSGLFGYAGHTYNEL